MPGYRTRQTRIAIPGIADLFIRSLLDRQQYSDPDGAAERLGISSAAWPLFGQLWPSALQLASFISRLAAPVAEVWVVDPDRGNRPPLQRAMAGQGFTMEAERLQAAGDDAAYKGRLLRFSRS